MSIYLHGTHVQKKVGQYALLVLGKNVTGEKIQDKTMGQEIIWGNGGQGWQGEQRTSFFDQRSTPTAYLGVTFVIFILQKQYIFQGSS